MRSLSKFGLSQVVVTFREGTDMLVARQLINERLATVVLPPEVERPKMGPMSNGLGEVFHYVVLSYGSDRTKARTVHEWVIRPQIRAVPGAAEINSWGGFQKQYQVRIRPGVPGQVRADVRPGDRGDRPEQPQRRRRDRPSRRVHASGPRRRASDRRGGTAEHRRRLPRQERWESVHYAPHRDGDGKVIGIYAAADIHEQKLVEDELRRTNTILSAHFDNTPLAVIEWDRELRLVRWSGQAEKHLRLERGRNARQAPGGLAARLRGGRPRGRGHDPRLVRDGAARDVAHRNYRKDGSVIWVEWHNSALRDDAGRLVSILSLAQDVSSRIQAEERLQYMATHDALTALPNRLLLNDRLEPAIARARAAIAWA